MTFFSCRLHTTPILPRRLSSVLSKLSHKKLILLQVSPPLMSPGVICPPSDATDKEFNATNIKQKHCICQYMFGQCYLTDYLPLRAEKHTKVQQSLSRLVLCSVSITSMHQYPGSEMCGSTNYESASVHGS